MNSTRVEFDYRIEWRDEHGLLHRIGGPALEYSDGTRWWFKHGKLHRIDGPAVEHSDGSVEFWLDGIEVTSRDVGRLRFVDLSDRLPIGI